MVAAANPENIMNIFQGYHDFPRPYLQNGLEAFAWKNNGSLETPYFKGNYNPIQYTEERNHHLVLRIPKDIGQQMGNGSLVIQLEVDTREEEGWMEEVRINRAGPVQYKIFTEKKT